jgi:hypothetical protein
LLKPQLGGTSIGLEHALLLHGIHAREPSNGLIQVHGLGPLAGEGEGSL